MATGDGPDGIVFALSSVCSLLLCRGGRQWSRRCCIRIILYLISFVLCRSAVARRCRIRTIFCVLSSFVLYRPAMAQMVPYSHHPLCAFFCIGAAGGGPDGVIFALCSVCSLLCFVTAGHGPDGVVFTLSSACSLWFCDGRR